MASKFDVEVVFASTDEAVSALYHKKFREVPKTSVVKAYVLRKPCTMRLRVVACEGKNA